jgi:catechol 2,3-dioxygenase-like lactoylglutathione lyase family enzyme
MDDVDAGLDRRLDSDEKRLRAESTASTAHPATYKGTSPVKVRKFGHLVYEVSDIERSVRFWTQVMGFTECERNDKGMVFLRYGTDHHGIGLKPSTHKKRPASSAGMHIEHLAMEVENQDVLLKCRDYLRANGIPIVFEGRKGAGCNDAVNFLDPDGYEFELYCNIDQIGPDGRLRPKSMFKPQPTLEDAIANPVEKTW